MLQLPKYRVRMFDNDNVPVYLEADILPLLREARKLALWVEVTNREGGELRKRARALLDATKGVEG